ncbi:MAG: 4Fe-4S binding protein [Deltaproteobacteria bacterium]|nr:4Fe-4S binding protein [Deltaproteobacteria bacterium]
MIHDLFIDANRCIGCRACVEACSECPSHGGQSMIHLDFLDRTQTVQTAPTVCMHCVDPSCAAVCPADAIKIDDNGVVMTAMPERCIGCGNCSLACPFGVPQLHVEIDLMMKCDLCYDRTSAGLKPMCATVCPSGALYYGTRDEIEDLRRTRATNTFAFGDAAVSTRNHLMAPAGTASIHIHDGAGHSGRGLSRAEQQLGEALC